MLLNKRKARHSNNPDAMDLGKLASVLIIFSLLSFVTAWVFSFETQAIKSTDIYSNNSNHSSLVGPIQNKSRNETYEIRVKAVNMPIQSWAYIEGQVLDENKEYLFSFGKSLWNESGRDSEGYSWHESDDEYAISITLANAGLYYLQFNAESNLQPEIISLSVVKKLGSSLPHFWLGVLLLLIGIVLNEIKKRTSPKVLGRLRGADDEG